jgi:hypothetical protein
MQSVHGRIGGGAYALLQDGTLRRFDLHGRPTGDVADGVVAALTVGAYVCIADAAFTVHCARDHHHDRGCGDADMGSWFAIELSAAGGLGMREQNGDPCVFSAQRPEHCVAVAATCDRLCVAFPACGQLRCVDPCPTLQAAFTLFHPSPAL